MNKFARWQKFQMELSKFHGTFCTRGYIVCTLELLDFRANLHEGGYTPAYVCNGECERATAKK